MQWKCRKMLRNAGKIQGNTGKIQGKFKEIHDTQLITKNTQKFREYEKVSLCDNYVTI